jgi:signal transduction histidine kinase/DNA-binding NarL/FixJ family response regulator
MSSRDESSIKILLIEDDPADVARIREMLSQVPGDIFKIQHAAQLANGLQQLAAKGNTDVILLDLSLPDSQVEESFDRLLIAAPEVPIIVLGRLVDMGQALKSVRNGAQDYLVKDEIDGNVLMRAIRHAIERKRIERELHLRNKELTVLNAISASLSGSLNLDQILHNALDEVLSLHLFGLEERGAIFLVDERTNRLVPAAHRRFSENHACMIWPVETGQCACGLAAQRKEVIVADSRLADAEQVQCRPGSPLPPHRHVCLPLTARDSVLGVMTLELPPDCTIADRDIDLLRAISDQIGVALENARLYQDTRRRTEELNALRRAGQILTSILDLEKVLTRTMTEVRTMLDAEGASVLLHDPETDELAFAAFAGVGSEALEGRRIPSSEGIAGWAFSQEEPVLVRDAQTDPRFYDQIDASTGITTRSVLAVPLQHRGQTIGVVEAVNRAGAQFSEHHLELLIVLSRSVATAIENARLYQETAQRLAETEVLREVMLDAASTLDFEKVLTRALDAIHRTLGVEFLTFLLPDETGEHLVAHRHTIGFPLPQGEFLISVDASVAGRVYLTGEPALIEDTTQVPYHYSGEDWPPLRSELAVPVRVGDEVIAVLVAEDPQRGAFTEEDLRIFEAIGAQLGIVMDNARLFEAEREQRRLVEQSQAQLVQSEKLAATGRLAASLTHEINNPLQAIRSGLQLVLSSEMTPEKQQAYLEMANEEVERLQRMVARTLDFARRPRWNPIQFDPHTVIERILALSNKYRQHRHVTLELDLMDDPPTIRGVPDEMEQVFLNLVLNAIEAMPHGGTLRILSFLKEERLAISFTDTGEGIPPEHLGHIFDPFFSTKDESTGLGLSISYDIVERHQGKITVESEVDGGTTFTVWLPVIDQEE